MGTRSTIMDTNSFRPEHAAELDHATRKLTDKRNKILGESYRLFYRNPVHLVKDRAIFMGCSRSSISGCLQQCCQHWSLSSCGD